jgi:hypothetical protein
MTPHPKWAARKPDPSSWKPRPGRSRKETAAEQDKAAGGREQRLVRVGAGSTARASIELKDLEAVSIPPEAGFEACRANLAGMT